MVEDGGIGRDGDVGADSAGLVAEAMRQAGVGPGELVGLAVAPGVGVGLAAGGRRWALPAVEPGPLVAELERARRPRWVWWSPETAAVLHDGRVRPARCWDVAAAHRIVAGGWAADPALVWAVLHGVDPAAIPTLGQQSLLVGTGADDEGDPEEPARPDGHLRPEWVSGGWCRTPDRLARWADAARQAAQRQRELLRRVRGGGDAVLTVHAESAAELLCLELARDGLPIDRAEAERIIAAAAGPRPRDAAEAARLRARRDAAVLRHLPSGADRPDLRSPAQVRTMLAGLGIDVPDTRGHRLEALAGAHPVVAALLAWRKTERIVTTYGYSWLDRFVGADGRLRGSWSAGDGAAGRMTASSGLHNLPAELRPAITAAPGHRLVRADLGQIEPRILAAVSGDARLVEACREDDLYAPVAARLGVDRAVAKVAMIAAMYGQTSGAAGRTQESMRRTYPAAMGYLRRAYDTGRRGGEVRTHGGRRLAFGPIGDDVPASRRREISSARAMFARNAVVQGAAAEFFKVWAVTVRSRLPGLDTSRTDGTGPGAAIVLCLHDELLVHAPADQAEAVRDLVLDALARTAALLCLDHVRFVADVTVLTRWSDAKTSAPHDKTPAQTP